MQCDFFTSIPAAILCQRFIVHIYSSRSLVAGGTKGGWGVPCPCGSDFENFSEKFSEVSMTEANMGGNVARIQWRINAVKSVVYQYVS